MAAADRPHLVLWLGRARPWYAERMGSLTSTAQLWSRARPAHAVRARSPRRAFAHQAGGGASRAQSHGALVCRHGLFVRRGSRLHRATTSRARGTRGMCPATALGASCACAPATHLPLPNVRFTAARHVRFDRHHHHHRQRGRSHLLRSRVLFFRRVHARSRTTVAAAGHCEAARSSKAAIKVAVATHQGGGHLQAARAARPRAPGSSIGALRPANGTRPALMAAGKKCAHGAVVFGHSRVPERAQACQ